MTKITITEALAEIPTIAKRIQKKQEFIKTCLYRQSVVRDQHEKSGGSAILIEREFQAIHDLQERLINIRSAIQRSNQETTITIENTTRTITDWLTWRREVSQGITMFYGQLMQSLNAMRGDAMRKGYAVTDKDTGFSPDYVVNINEKNLADSAENIETVLGALDGQLSLKNATTFIELP